MLASLVPLLLAVAAGIGLVVQQALNAGLRGGLDSAAWAGFVSYAVGTLCMVALIVALRDPIPTAATMARIPPYWWIGGVFGAGFIGLAILLVPQIGAATFFALLITGQMLASLTLDHFGWFGLAERPVDPLRLLGAALLIGGVILIRR